MIFFHEFEPLACFVEVAGGIEGHTQGAEPALRQFRLSLGGLAA